MKTLIIYDNNGTIFSQMAGDVSEPSGIPFMWVEMPEGKILGGIDVSTEIHHPIFIELPKSEVALLKKQVDALNIALAEIMGV